MIGLQSRNRWYMLAGVACLGSAAAVWGVLCLNAPVLSADEQRVVDLVNDVRVLDKLPRLEVQRNLTELARAHARHLKEVRRVEFPFPKDLEEDLVRKANYPWEKYGMVVDVIHGLTVEQAFESWLQVNEPLAEILSIYHEDVGVGVVIDQQGEDTIYYVALLFARKKH